MTLTQTLISEADRYGSSTVIGGCCLVTAAQLEAERMEWDDGDASKGMDTTLYPYWIVTDDDQGPFGVRDASDVTLTNWCDQYAPDQHAGQED